MPHTLACEVEFFGGPLDGHVESMGLPLHAFLGVKVVAAEQHKTFLHAWLSKWRSQPKHSVISIYELGSCDSRVSYRYLRSQAISAETQTPQQGIDTLVRRLVQYS